MTTAQVEVFPVPPLPPQVGAVMIFNEIILPLIGVAFGGLVLWGLYRTVNRYLERRHGAAHGGELEAMQSEVEQLRSQTAGVEHLALRVGELEERLDFAERLLTHERERRARLGAGDAGASE
jgi:HAMP domain-containing protein